MSEDFLPIRSRNDGEMGRSDHRTRRQGRGAKLYLDQVIARKLELQGVGADSDVTTSIDAVATSVGRERPDLATHAAFDGTVTVLFSDSEGSTALNTRLGDQRWMELLREHNTIMCRAIAEHGGFEVKTEGDGFMIAFGPSRDGLRFAIAAQQALDARNAALEKRDPAVEGIDDLASTTALWVRTGLHVGEVVREGTDERADCYGRHVAMAARVASRAAGDEVLVSSLLRELVEPSGEFAFKSREPVALKGLDGEHVLHTIEWR